MPEERMGLVERRCNRVNLDKISTNGQRVKGTVGGVTTTHIGNYYEWNGTAAQKAYFVGSTRVAVLETTGTL
jgi:hypothetical protein